MKKIMTIVTLLIALPCFIKPNTYVEVEKGAFVQPIDNLVLETQKVKQSLDSLTTKLEEIE